MNVTLDEMLLLNKLPSPLWEKVCTTLKDDWMNLSKFTRAYYEEMCNLKGSTAGNYNEGNAAKSRAVFAPK